MRWILGHKDQRMLEPGIIQWKKVLRAGEEE